MLAECSDSSCPPHGSEGSDDGVCRLLLTFVWRGLSRLPPTDFPMDVTCIHLNTFSIPAHTGHAAKIVMTRITGPVVARVGVYLELKTTNTNPTRNSIILS